MVEERRREWERGDIVGERRFHLEIRDNGSNVVFKAHVYHAISFVQAQVSTHIQVQGFLSQHIHKTSRGCNDYMHTAGVVLGLEWGYNTDGSVLE